VTLSFLGWLVWGALALLSITAISFWLRRRGEFIAPFPVFLTTTAFYVLPRAAYLLWSGRAPLTSPALPPVEHVQVIVETLGVTLGAVMMFILGHHRRSALSLAARLRFNIPSVSYQRALWVATIVAVPGLLTPLFLIQSVGGVTYAFAHQSDMPMLLGDRLLFLQITRLTTVAVALLIIDDRNRRIRPWVLALALFAAVEMIPLGFRSYLIPPLVLPFAMYHLQVRRIPIPAVVLAGIAGTISLFAFSYVRLLGSERVIRAAKVFAENPATAVHFVFNASGELKVFDATSIVVRDVPSEWPYNLGASFVRVPWMAIPRRLWPEKPITSGHEIIRRYLPNLRTAYPPMAVGEFYMAGGLLAVIVGFWCFGWIARVGWEWYRRHPGVGNSTLYLTFCFFVFDFTRVGDPSRTVWFLVPGAAFLIVCFCVASPSFTRRELPARSSRGH
jgi:hypothetical protein